MAHLNYQRSRNREYYVFHRLEEDGWLTFRTSGSHGVADIIAIKPNPKDCANPNHYEVMLVQVKVSEKIKIEGQEIKAIETKHFPVNVNYSSFPVKSKKYYDKFRKSKRVERRKLKSRKPKRSAKR